MVVITGGALDTTLPYVALPVMIFPKVKELSPWCAFVRVFKGTAPMQPPPPPLSCRSLVELQY